MMRDKPMLVEKIHEFKYHPIMLQQHKSEHIYNLLEPEVRKLVIVESGDIEDYTIYEKNYKHK